MTDRGFVRGLAMFVEIIMTLMLILFPILGGFCLAEKIGFGLIWGFFTILMINPISGKTSVYMAELLQEEMERKKKRG